ncbi:MAG TPA: hypothetical protein VM513_20405 [Kofleriaceae bacterium]|jgi:hypothetical protein|nr:hypothetical protein [Kofleriaceae bacterium]
MFLARGLDMFLVCSLGWFCGCGPLRRFMCRELLADRRAHHVPQCGFVHAAFDAYADAGTTYTVGGDLAQYPGTMSGVILRRD